MPNRSPIIVALLFAATLAVDVVGAYWIITYGLGVQQRLFYYAATYAQLSLLACWAVLYRPRIGWRWIAPFVAGVVFAAVWTTVLRVDEPPPPNVSLMLLLMTFVGIYWLHAAGATVLLWLLKPSGLIATRRNADNSVPWQFSVAHLLILTTCGCLLLTLFVANRLLVDSMPEAFTIVADNIALLAVLIIAYGRPWHWLLRLAAAAGAAILIGFLGDAFSRDWPGNHSFVTYNLVQAFIVCVWLEIGPVLPAKADTGAAAGDAARSHLAQFQSEP